MNILKHLIIYISCPFLVLAQNLPASASEEPARELVDSALPEPSQPVEDSALPEPSQPVVDSALPEPVEVAEKSVYGLFIEGKGGGTGFFIAPYLFVTNFHVIVNAESLDDIVLFQNQERSPIKVEKVYAVDGFSDLALLQTDRRSEHFLSQGPAPQSSDQVFNIGYSRYNNGFPVFTSSVAEIIKYPLYYNMAFDTDQSFGSSGSPLLNSLGQVIGVIFIAANNIKSSVTASTLHQLMQGEKGVVCEASGRTCIDEEIHRVRRELLRQMDSEDQTTRDTLFHHSPQYLKRFLSREQFTAYLLKGAETQVVHAQYHVGVFFSFEHNKLEESFYWIHQAAEQGDPVAQNQVGILYLNGTGIDPNAEEALRWFKKSSDQKFTKGMFNTAYALLTGSGVEKDIDQAISLLKETARYGNKEAWYALGALLYFGLEEEIEPDPQSAVPFFLQAALFGHKKSECNMGVIYEEGKWVEQDLEASAYWYAQCEGSPN